MTAFLNRVKQQRGSRISAVPSAFSCAVQFSDETRTPRWAQFGDISETGVKLITTRPHLMEVGSVIELRFSLSGGSDEVVQKARVVRLGSEFVLGLQFLNPSDEFKKSLFKHIRYVSRLPIMLPMKTVQNWFSEHKLGLKVALAAFTFFILTLSLIYVFSDDHAGKMRPWGQSTYLYGDPS